MFHSPTGASLMSPNPWLMFYLLHTLEFLMTAYSKRGESGAWTLKSESGDLPLFLCEVLLTVSFFIITIEQADCFVVGSGGGS